MYANDKMNDFMTTFTQSTISTIMTSETTVCCSCQNDNNWWILNWIEKRVVSIVIRVFD